MEKTKFAEVQGKLFWPLPQDYNEALQNPDANFADLELQDGLPELNQLGLPRSITGSFASVYRFKCPKKDYAVRCFLTNVQGQQRRYAKISECLNRVNLPIMADFDYLPNCIRVQGRWFPVLKMDWIDGQNLIEYVGRNLDNPPLLEKLRQWLKAVRKALAINGIAHGDLQHGNILVTNSGIKLVDYDGMYVPELSGQVSNELGHRNYQHPKRSKNDFGPHLDNFSAWVIDTSLFCLERDPRLWFDLNGGDDCLLFREADFQDPLASNAFHVLENHKDPEIQARARMLRSLIDKPLSKIPDLDEEIEIPGDLSVLNPVSKKPNWLSSADELMAKEVSPIPSPINREGYYEERRITYPPVLEGTSYEKAGQKIDAFGRLVLLSFVIFWFLVPTVIMPWVRYIENTAEVTQLSRASEEFNLGSSAFVQEKYSVAEGHYKESLKQFQQNNQTNEAAECLYWLGRTYLARGMLDQAEAMFDGAYAIYAPQKENFNLQVAQVAHAQGLVKFERKNYQGAADDFEHSLRFVNEMPAGHTRDELAADVNYVLAWSYVGGQHHTKADALFRQLIKYYDVAKPPGYVADRMCDIANYYISHQNYPLAKAAFTLAKRAAQSLPAKDPELIKRMQKISYTLKRK